MNGQRVGRWVAAGVTLVALVLAARLLSFAARPRPAGRGDGRTVASYGFNLAGLALPHGQLVAAGMPRDGVHALTHPEVWSPDRMDAQRSRRRAPRLLAGDPVIGVVAGSQARAYPLRLLAWHEVVNDTLGEVPLLVVHHPLSGLSAVFLRHLPDGSTPEFRVSGLLWNSGPILYHRAAEGETLWSPLLARAIAGPASGTLLEVYPAWVTTWGDWRARHPATTVLAPLPTFAREYRRDPYSSYLGSDLLRFPATPPWPTEELPRKTPTLVLALATGTYLAVPYPTAASVVGPDGRARLAYEGQPLELELTRRPPLLRLPQGDPRPSLAVFAFAWHAAHPTDTKWLMPENRGL